MNSLNIYSTIKPDLFVRVKIDSDDNSGYAEFAECDAMGVKKSITDGHPIDITASIHPKYGKKLEDMKWQINWGGYGDSSAEFTENFLTILHEALRTVKRLNNFN